MSIDPVCEMEIEETTDELKSEYNNEDYYFCSSKCKIKLDENPEQYVS